MKLEDLDRINELRAWLDHNAALAARIGPETPIVLNIGDDADLISPEEATAFFQFRRMRILAELQKLGVKIDGAPSPARDNTPVRRGGDTQFGVAAQRPADLTEARRQARDHILGPWLKDRRPPISDDPQVIRDWQDEVDQFAERRAADIEQLAQEMLHPPAESVCRECDEPATTVIAGNHYCSVHAEAQPRPAPPPHLVHLVA